MSFFEKNTISAMFVDNWYEVYRSHEEEKKEITAEVTRDSFVFCLARWAEWASKDLLVRLDTLDLPGSSPNIQELYAARDGFIHAALGWDANHESVYKIYGINDDEPSGQAFRTAMYGILLALKKRDDPEIIDELTILLGEPILRWLTTKYVTVSSGMLHKVLFSRTGVVSMFPPMMELAEEIIFDEKEG